MRHALLIFTFFIFVSLHAQEKQLAVSYENVALQQVLSDMEKAFSIRFSYNNVLIADKVFSATGSFDLTALLQQITQQNSLYFERVDASNIIIKTSPPEASNIFCGTVLDAFSQAPLEAATISLQSSSQGVLSLKDGSFVLPNVAEDDIILIQYLGYKTIEVVLADRSGSNCETYLLQLGEQALDEIVLTEYITTGFDRNNSDGSLLVKPRKLGILPGLTEPDVLQSLQLLPGISSPEESASDLHIRGGTPDQNLVLWDGIKMYHQGHFFGQISAFNPYITDQVEVYRSGTSVKYGDRISGVIDIKSTNKIPEKLEVGAGFNFTQADIFAKIPVDKDLGLILSARRSYSDLIETVTFKKLNRKVFQNTKIDNGQTNLEEEFDIVDNTFYFTDFNIKAIWKPSEKDHIAFSSLFVTNDLDYQARSSETFDKDNLDLINNGYSLVWNRQQNDRLRFTISSYLSNYESDFVFNELEIEDNEVFDLSKKNNVDDFGITGMAHLNFGNEHGLLAGYDFNSSRVFYTIDSAENGQVESDEFEDDNLNAHAVYGEYQYTNKAISLRAGVRANYFSSDKRVYVEPRLSTEIRITEDLALKASGEIKNQVISQLLLFDFNDIGVGNNIWVLADAVDIPVLNNKQLTLGFLFAKKGWKLDVDGYYKRIKGMTSFGQGFNNSSLSIADYAEGSSEIYGLDVLLKKRIGNFRTWVSYSISKTNFLFPDLQSSTFPGNFDQRHTLTFSNTVTLKQFQFSLGWTFNTGKPFSQPQGIETMMDGDDVVNNLIYTEQNNGRLENYHRLDASVVYDFFLGNNKRYKARIGASLLNIYNRDNQLDKVFRIANNEDDDDLDAQIIEETRTGLGITPNIVFRINF